MTTNKYYVADLPAGTATDQALAKARALLEHDGATTETKTLVTTVSTIVYAVTVATGPLASRLDELEDARIATAKSEHAKLRRGPWGILVRMDSAGARLQLSYNVNPRQLTALRKHVKVGLNLQG